MNTGKVMWIRHRDGIGIILMENGNEVYFDSSVTKEFDLLNKNDLVQFQYNMRISDCRCGYNVEKIKVD